MKGIGTDHVGEGRSVCRAGVGGLLLIGLLAGLWVGLERLSAEAVITVCTEAQLTNAVAVGGRIVFGCDGTIASRRAMLIGVDTELDGNGRVVTLSGGQSNRLFTIAPGVTLTLRGIRVSGGKHEGDAGREGERSNGGDGWHGRGGAVLNEQGTLIAVDTMFLTNSAVGGVGGAGAAGAFLFVNGGTGGAGGHGQGGAIYNDGGVVWLTHCVLRANRAVGGDGGEGGQGASGELNGNGGAAGNGGWGMGGAIASVNGGTVHLVNCTFSDNQVEGGLGGEAGLAGGGITFDGRDGRAGSAEAGGVRLQGGTMIVLNTTFDGNRVNGAAGLDALGGRRAENGNDGNDGGWARGGAVVVNGGSGAFTNCTWSANAVVGGAGGEGGQGGSSGFGGNGGDGGDGGAAVGGSVALYGSGSVTLVNCTLAGNAVTGGSGAIGGNGGTVVNSRGRAGGPGVVRGANVANEEGTLKLVNVILAEGEGSGNVSGMVEDGGHNLSSDSTPEWGHGLSRNGIDPRLGALAENGGATRTMALLAGSPAVDGGDDVAAPGFDQRGYVRVGTSDIGAYELEGSSPGLRVEMGMGEVVISWPVAMTGYRLEWSVKLVGEWEETAVPAVIGLRYVVTEPVIGAARFYRLVR
jgi:hypothetical protein